ncbi:MAG: hypothetical protein IKR09_09670 [Alphaproteobacteria bacterium]|nr:hypothetical protein [Alphaproteobacteria bacterium]
MRHLYRIIVLFLVFIILSFFNFCFEKEVLNTIYNVSGIMFSVGLGLIVGTTFSELKNTNYLKSVRQNLKYIRSVFIYYFLAETFLFLFVGNKFNTTIMHYNIKYDTFFAIFSIYTIIYFTFNFLQIQKLNEDITDKKNKEREKD